MSVKKRAAQIISVLFHPLIMPALGMVILFNSGSYLSLIPAEVKKVVILVTILSTLIFPLSLLSVLYFRKLISDLQINKREERYLPMLLILIIYILTFIFMVRLPLNPIIQAYALTFPVTVTLLILVNIKFKISAHMMGLGSITGLISSLMILFGVSLQVFFILGLLAAGLTGTSRILLGYHSSFEVYSGFGLGLIASGMVMLIF